MKHAALFLMFAGVLGAAPVIDTSAQCSVFAPGNSAISASSSGVEECRLSEYTTAGASVAFLLAVSDNAVQASWNGESAASWNSVPEPDGDNGIYVESSAIVSLQADFDMVTGGDLRPGFVRVTGFGFIYNPNNSFTYFEAISPVAPFLCKPVGSAMPAEMPCSYQLPGSDPNSSFQLDVPVLLGSEIPVRIKAGTVAHGSIVDTDNQFGYGGFAGFVAFEFFEEDGATPALLLPLGEPGPPPSGDIDAPEPSTWFMGGLGLLALMGLRSRSRA